MNNRRSFFRTLLVPLVAFALPKRSLASAIDDDINPEWNGTVGSLDQINAITSAYIDSQMGAYLPDTILCSSSTYEYLNAKWALGNDPNVQWSPGDKFYRKPGEPWKRLHGSLRWPERAPRLPA